LTAPANQIELSVDGNVETIGAGLNVKIILKVQDEFGNTVSDYIGTVDLVLPLAVQCTTGNTVTFVSGLATALIFSEKPQSVVVSLDSSSTVLTIGIPIGFTVTAGGWRCKQPVILLCRIANTKRLLDASYRQDYL